MANSMGIENSPNKLIGPTKFSYIIGVYDSKENRIAMGAKSAVARSIKK